MDFVDFKWTEFIPYNLSENIQDVAIAYQNGRPIACAGLKKPMIPHPNTL